MTDMLVNEIGEVVRAACGLVVDPARRDVLNGLVARRCDRLRLAGPAQYLTRIRDDPAELQLLIEGLTVGETYFARIPPQIRALQELVLPSLLGRDDHRIRIWCAGCATGEEAYTIALLLAKLLDGRSGAAGKRAPDTWDVRVIGTDINSTALTAARIGRYGQRAIGLLDDDDLQRYFVRDGNSWMVGPRLRQLVEFRQHNLTSRVPPAPRLDLILCRNVLIYFDRQVMLEVVDAMHSALVPDGWLLLGHSETLWRLYDGFELVRHDDAFLYRRRAAVATAVRRPPPRPRSIPQPLAPRAADPLDEVRDALSTGAHTVAADLAAAHLERDPLSAQLHYLHGLALVELGSDAQALTALRRASYLDPGSGFAQFLLAVVLGRLGHGAEASRAYGAASQALARLEPHQRAPEFGGRRVHDLAEMCRQLAGGAWQPTSQAGAP